MRAIPDATAALIERLKRESPHRNRNGLAEPPGPGRRSGRNLTVHALSIPARPWTHRAPTGARQSHRAQEVRSRVRQSDLASPTCSSARGSSAPAAARCRCSCRPRSTMPAALIPHAQFYPNQGLDSFLDCLRQAIAARGLPTRLYMDNAKIYRSPQLSRIAASIGILIVHHAALSTRRPPARSNASSVSVREQFLSNLDPRLCFRSIIGTNDSGTGSIPSITAASTARFKHPAVALWPTGQSRRCGNCRRHRHAPSVLPSRRPPGAPRFHVPAAPSFLRSAALSGRQEDRGAFRSARSGTVGNLLRRKSRRARARPVDAVVNGRTYR